MSRIEQIINDSAYKLGTVFNKDLINELEERIKEEAKGDKTKYYVECLVRNKEIELKPEEVIRQLYLLKLNKEYGYPYDIMKVESEVTFGREKKRADIIIFEEEHPTEAYIIIEVKKPKLKDGKEQLKSYCNATGASMAVWTNGEKTSYYRRIDPNHFVDIQHIPKHNQTLEDVLKKPFTIKDLKEQNRLDKENRTLKDIIEEMEDEILANAGVDVFEEVFKIIFAKLYDEFLGVRDEKRNLEFRNGGQSDNQLKEKINNLFDNAKEKWEGIFSKDDKIKLTPSHIAVCVGSLEKVKLFNSNLDVIDQAFEYLVNKNSKGEKGQYFTPRHVIDMCVKMLNPKENETLIDTACGSAGFTMHGIFHVWRAIAQRLGVPITDLFSAEEKPQPCIDYVRKNVFGIDFDEKAVRVARALNIIAGDGQTNILHLNTLDYRHWENTTKDDIWNETYIEGFKKLRRLTDKSYKEFTFDVLMANPPFAGDIKEGKILSHYELAKDNKDKSKTAVGRDILFIERNLDFLKPGGRMAVVLPQGRFNNTSDKYIREFLADKCRILAVVGLDVNTFKPHTGTKTSVLFVQKWDDELCPKVEDYPIFFAVSDKGGKDNSGNYIYVKDEHGKNKKDEHGHEIVDHDLHNHYGYIEDGIAEAFLEFAKEQKFSFV